MIEPTSGLGTDPAKWAEAFLEAVGSPSVGARSKADRLALVADWFAAAMEAAVEDYRTEEHCVIEGDNLTDKVSG